MNSEDPPGIVGARGYTRRRTHRLVASHPGIELAFVSSRELGTSACRPRCRIPAATALPSTPTRLPPIGVDAVVLALPNSRPRHVRPSTRASPIR